MINLKDKYGAWALITGASSGIGKEFARQLAKQKFNLVLVARRKERLSSLAEELEKTNNINVTCIALDLTDPAFISKIVQHTCEIDIGLLVNNAGFAVSGNFLESSIQKQSKLLDLNIKSLTQLTHYFGNKMVAKNKGGVINIASASAYLPIANWSVYAASKAYVLRFTEALWYEFRNTGVDVLALCPGATKTEFNESFNSPKGMEVSIVTATALKKLGKGPTVIVGNNNKIIVCLLKLLRTKAKILLGARIVRSNNE
jgi:short-subunit dehydrogenase